MRSIKFNAEQISMLIDGLTSLYISAENIASSKFRLKRRLINHLEKEVNRC